MAEIDRLLQQIRLKSASAAGPSSCASRIDAGLRGASGHHDPRAREDAGAGHLRGCVQLPEDGVDVQPEVMIPRRHPLARAPRISEAFWRGGPQEVMVEQGSRSRITSGP